MKSYFTHYKSLARLGVPIIIGQLGTIVLGFADTMMIGWHSMPELAAAAFVNNMFVLILIFAMGFTYGLTPIIGSLYGRGETGRIGGMLKNSMVVNTFLSLVLMGIMALLYMSLGYLGQPDELIPLMRPYFLVNLLSVPFVVWFNTFKQLADGTTDTKTPMWILLGGNLLNIVGNYILIYGKAGFPELGLLGAGISTCFSRIVMAVAFAVVFVGTRRYRAYWESFKASSVNRADALHLNSLGWPLGLQMGMETAAFSLSSVMVGWIGTTALAAHQVMLTISQFFYMVYYGMAAAVAIRVSYFHGQRDYKAINATSSAGFHLILFIAFCVSVPVFIFRHSLGGLFTDSAEVCNLVAFVVIPLVVYQFGDGLQCAYANALRGLSDVKPLMYVAFVAYFVISLPLGYFFGIFMGWGLLGVWSAFPFGLTSAGVLYYICYRRRMRKEQLALVED